jgi:hypothetical protein
LAKKALEVAEHVKGLNYHDMATSLVNLADLYRETNRKKEAEALEKRAAEIRAKKR